MFTVDFPKEFSQIFQAEREVPDAINAGGTNSVSDAFVSEINRE